MDIEESSVMILRPICSSSIRYSYGKIRVRPFLFWVSMKSLFYLCISCELNISLRTISCLIISYKTLSSKFTEESMIAVG
jgi:hypothetical protein